MRKRVVPKTYDDRLKLDTNTLQRAGAILRRHTGEFGAKPEYLEKMM